MEYWEIIGLGIGCILVGMFLGFAITILFLDG